MQSGWPRYSAGTGLSGVPVVAGRGRTAASHVRLGRKPETLLKVAVALGTLGPLLALASPSRVASDMRDVAGLLWVLCLLPSWFYVVAPPQRRRPIPLMPLIGLAYALYYVLQLLVGGEPLNEIAVIDPTTDYARPIQLVMVGWLALAGGYWLSGTLTAQRPRSGLAAAALPRVPLVYWGLGLLYGGLLTELVRQTSNVAAALGGPLQFLASLALFGATLLVAFSTHGRLTPYERLAFYVAIAVLALLRIGSGSVSNAVVLALTLFLAGWLSGRRITLPWVIVGIVSLVFFVSLRGIAYDYRKLVWFGAREVPVTQRPRVYLGLLAERARSTGPVATVQHGWDVVAGRSANLDLFADVVRRTPSSVPYWGGETYLSLVGAFVPRFLWPNKPQKLLGGAFGHRYGYLHERDRSTSINFPYLIEFYANFGEIGVLLGMLVVGMVFGILEAYVNRPGQSYLVSACGLVLLLPMLNIESDFSLVFGGLILNGGALYVLLRAIRRTLPRASSIASSGATRAGAERRPA